MPGRSSILPDDAHHIPGSQAAPATYVSSWLLRQGDWVTRVAFHAVQHERPHGKPSMPTQGKGRSRFSQMLARHTAVDAESRARPAVHFSG
jgi:hypothetical protein